MWGGGSAQGHRRARGAILERPHPPGHPIEYAGPRSLRCDLIWPGACRAKEGWPSAEGRDGKKEKAAGSSEGPPESVRATLCIEIGRGSLREWAGPGMSGAQKEGEVMEGPGFPCCIPQCVSLPPSPQIPNQKTAAGLCRPQGGLGPGIHH